MLGLENFCESLSHPGVTSLQILSPQQVAQNQIRLNLCDLLRRQNSVAEISRKILQVHSRVICRYSSNGDDRMGEKVNCGCMVGNRPSFQNTK